MTHWVIRKYQGKIYAGVDKLASGQDHTSQSSGTGTMPNVHLEKDVAKLVAFATNGKQTLICCAGATFLAKKTSPSNFQETAQILNTVLPRLAWTSIQSAEQLMTMLSQTLERDYNLHSALRLGCGFAYYAHPQLTIAYYDSQKPPKIKNIMGDYLNINLEETDAYLQHSWQQSIGGAAGYNPAEFAIGKEIEDTAMKRPGRVSREYNINQISPLPSPISSSVPASRVNTASSKGSSCIIS